jgi:hypothetical protein
VTQGVGPEFKPQYQKKKKKRKKPSGYRVVSDAQLQSQLLCRWKRKDQSPRLDKSRGPYLKN